jgi:glycine hydroxymethyltransferase
MTTRGFREAEAEKTAELIADLLDNPRDPVTADKVRREVAMLTERFPVYG